jgi:uncharacterized membrane protein
MSERNHPVVKVILVFLLLIVPGHANAASPTFTNKVWARADSTGKANGDRYTFLNDGTFIITSPHGRAMIGNWSRKDDNLLIYENGRAYDATVASLTATKLRLRVNRWDETLDLSFVLANPSEPDSVQPYEGFNPNAFRVEAGGYEPSWGFVVEGGRAVMTMPGETTMERIEYMGAWTRVLSTVWTFTVGATNGNDNVILTIADGPNECSDECDYTMTADLKRGTSTWNGCARLSRFLK